MHPFAAVHTLVETEPTGAFIHILGSCFRLHDSKQCFITAHHCIRGYENKCLAILNPLGTDIPVTNIIQHSIADLAILVTKNQIPEKYEQLILGEEKNCLGTQVHCFGVISDYSGIPDPLYRVIGGIIQRYLFHEDGPYKQYALELSVPIPTGMSGAPAFYASKPNNVIGVALGSLESRIVIHAIEEYENSEIKEREKISRVVEYGIILRIDKIKEWLVDNLRRVY
jgi:hypothetical protein